MSAGCATQSWTAWISSACGRVLLGVGHPVTGGHEVQLAGPDRAARSPGCRGAAARRPPARSRSGGPCGDAARCRTPRPALTGTGPTWSTKHQDPTVRRGRWGRTRRTGSEPTWVTAARGELDDRAARPGPGHPGTGAASSVATGPLIAHPSYTFRVAGAQDRAPTGRQPPMTIPADDAPVVDDTAEQPLRHPRGRRRGRARLPRAGRPDASWSTPRCPTAWGGRGHRGPAGPRRPGPGRGRTA